MVKHDNLKAFFFGIIKNIKSGCAAVNGNNKIGPLCGKFIKSGRARTVTLFTFGYMHQRLAADTFQKQAQNRRRSCSVHVIVADYGDFAAGNNGFSYFSRRFGHILHDRRIRQQILQFGFNKIRDILRGNAAGRQNFRYQQRQIAALGDEFSLAFINRSGFPEITSQRLHIFKTKTHLCSLTEILVTDVNFRPAVQAFTFRHNLQISGTVVRHCLNQNFVCRHTGAAQSGSHSFGTG